MQRHVMFVLPTLRGGGAERVMVTLLRHLDRARFRVTLVVVDLSHAAYRSDLPSDVEVIDLHERRLLRCLPKLLRTIWSRSPDVVFSTLSHLNLALAAVRTLLPRKPRFVARESSVISRVIAGYRLPACWALAYRLFYRSFDLVVCQSRYMLDDLVEHFGYPAGKSVIINNPVDVERVRQLAGELPQPPLGASDTIELLAAGRLSSEKGFDLLISALAVCERPCLHLTILGDGPLHSQLTRLAIERGVASQVTFAGFQANPYPYFRRSDAFVLSSRYEGFPNVVLEALACGTPVIAVPAPGGITEILQRVPACSILADVSIESLSAALRSLSRPPRVPADAVRPYDVATIVRQYEDALA